MDNPLAAANVRTRRTRLCGSLTVNASFKSKLLVLTKIDLLPYVPFGLDVAIANARSIHPGIETLQLSSITGQGMGDWLKWIEKR